MPDIETLMKKYSGDEPVTATDKSKIDIEGLAKKYGMGEKIEEPAKRLEAPGTIHIPEIEKYIPPALTNFEQGLIRGVVDVFATGGKGVAYLDKLLLPGGEERHKKYNEAIKAEKERYEKEYGESTAANVGRVGGQILATAPIMGATLPTTGIAAGMGALPTVAATGARIAAPLSRRLGAAAITGALGGAEFGGLTQAATDESLAESVGKGAITGAVGGPVLAGAAAGAKGLGRLVAGKISPEITALAQRAEDLGIRLTAPQIASKPYLSKYEQQTGYLPFSGKQGIVEEQQKGINRAVSRTFGQNTDKLSSELVDKSLKNIGNEINIAAKNTTIDNPSVNLLKNDFIRILHEADKVVVEDEMKVIFKQILNIADKVDNNGNLSGEAYNALTKYNGVLSKAQKSSNPNIKSFANEIRHSLDDALERSANPTDRQALINARKKYKAAKTIEDLVESDPQGNVSVLKLMSAVKKAPGGKSGAGELGEIADIGQQFFKQMPESGTPLGNAVLQNLPLLSHATAGTAAILGGHAIGGIVGGAKVAAGLAANKLARAGITSPAAARALVNMGKGSTSGKLDELTSYATPYVSFQIGEPVVEKVKKLKLPVALR